MSSACPVVITPLSGRDLPSGSLADLIAGGVLVGVLQWLLLRGQMTRAGWWVVASAVGGIAGVGGALLVGSPFLGFVIGMQFVRALVVVGYNIGFP